MGKMKERATERGPSTRARTRRARSSAIVGPTSTPTASGATSRAKRKGDAEKALRQAMTDADRGLVLDAGKLTVGEYLERWLSDCLTPLVKGGKMEHSTYVRYAGNVGQSHLPHPRTKEAHAT